MESLNHQQYSTRLPFFLSFKSCTDVLSGFFSTLRVCCYTRRPFAVSIYERTFRALQYAIRNMQYVDSASLLAAYGSRRICNWYSVFSCSSKINAMRYARVRMLFCKLCCTHFVYWPEIRNTDNSRASRDKTICTLKLIRIRTCFCWKKPITLPEESRVSQVGAASHVGRNITIGWLQNYPF